ncbi:hypothetical protein CL644_01690 [bacterium]|nr:hypothetical protein [bacterium]|tara:strand:- start:8726 stop:9952 length:1227 start_codon:yes stop_codon:yes gene_type:complete
MKIAIIAGRDPKIHTDTDGGSVYLEYLQSKLQDKSHDVTTYIPQGVKGGIVSSQHSYKQKLNKNNSNQTIYFPLSIQHQNRGIISQEDYFYRRIDISKACVDYFSDKKLFDYDAVFILHCANAFGITEKDLLPFERTVLFPMMTTMHYKKFTTVPSEYEQLERATLSKMQHISTPSDEEADVLLNFFSLEPSRVFKTNRGFSVDDFPFHQHTRSGALKEIKILSANGIRPQKNHLFFVDLTASLLSAGITPRILLTGNNGRSHNPTYNNYTKQFWNYAREKGVQDYITAYDVIPRAQLVRLLVEADIALYPSTSETFGKSALESAASGLPTIVFDDIPAFTEFITHNETGIITQRSIEACTRVIIDLCLDDISRYQYISEQGKTLRNRFNWNTIFASFFEQLKLRGII